MSPLLLRPATATDDPAVAELLARSFPANPKAHPEVLAWQYRANPFGAAVQWVWEDRGALVCHWACVPVPLSVDGRRVVGLKTADAATDPAYRGRGLFAELGRRLMADCAGQGYPFALSHPNPNAVRGVQQAGGRLVARVPAYVRPTTDGLLVRRLHLPRPLASVVRRAAFPAPRGQVAGVLEPGPPEGLDGLWQATQAGTGIARDAAWWRWRYAARPGAAYRFGVVRAGDELAAAAVSFERDAYGGRFLTLLEVLARDTDAAAGVVAALLEEAQGQGGVDGVAGIALDGTAHAQALAAAGLRRVPRALEPAALRFLVIDLAERAPRHGWQVAWGDLDHL